MKKTGSICSRTIIGSLCLLVNAPAWTDEAQTEAAGKEPVSETITSGPRIKQPPKQKPVEFGGDFRFRIIQEEARKLNADERTNDRLWQRFRLRIWSAIHLGEHVDLNGRIIAEPRHYNEPPSTSSDDTWVRDEILIDRLNIVLKDLSDLPMTATIGRQGIRIADSWLVGEGTPLDGTRSDYFDAARLIWAFGGGRTTIDLSWIENRKNSSSMLSPINDIDFDMIEQDERGLVAYIDNEVAGQLFIQPYFIYKKDFNPGSTGVEGETYTTGLRGHGNIADTVSFNAEVARQFGHKNGKELNALAANLWGQWTAQTPEKTSFRLGYEYTSGDNDKDLQFDKLWGREALWSDLYTGGVDGFDSRQLDSANLHRPHAIFRMTPLKPLRLFAEYSLLFADTYVQAGSNIDNGSMFKGHHAKAAIEHQITKNLKHYVTAQALIPGDYYSDYRSDTASWFRYSFEVKW